MKDDLPLDRPVTDFLSDAAFTLHEHLSIDEALATLRASQPPVGSAGGQPQQQVIYFYVINAADQLVGILPARHLVLSPGNTKIADIMTRSVITMNARETLFDALELFAMHRLLAIPVVDARQKFLGIVDVSLYTEEVFNLAQNRQLNEVFQLIGVHLEQQRHASAWLGFRLRMPWLLANITGGLVCAALGSFFEATVQQVVLLALFTPLILTLAESVAVQSMTLAIEQAGVRGKETLLGLVWRELRTALLLGLCSGLIVGLVSLFWGGAVLPKLVIGGSVAAVMLLAAALGQLVPRAIHGLKLNPRIASGPITLALVDIVTVTVYLSAATALLRK
jgi:magnesium transporter